ncbi:condensation domain-containing protein [Kitasatospora sp. NPDC056327]|uniref:condensation domain-containing protein n=1 Tax=Kitasatospora sp. NPDC056327 TaxID=3345785 RepID=UPI0035DF4665
MSESRAVPVRFAGLRAGSAPLSWGQHAIWKSIRWLGEESHYFNIPRAVPVPPGCPVDAVTAAVERLIHRHEALRSTFADTPAGPVQTVAGEGAAEVEVFEAGRPVPREEALELAQRLAGRAFDHATGFGMRYAVVTAGGEPVWLLLVVSHQCTDFFGIRVIEAELATLLAGGEPDPADWHPLDQARFQQGGEGAARGRASLDFWRRTLTRVPRSHFDFARTGGPADPADPGEPADPERFVRLRLDSPAGAVAADLLATRCQVSTSTVLLTAAAAVVAAYSGHDTAVLQLIAGNRNEPRLRGMVGAQTENALFVLNVADGTFEDAVRRCFLPGMSAYRFGEYHPPSMDAVHDEVRLHRGVGLDLSSFFNDVRMNDRWESLPETDGSAEQLAALAERSEISFIGAWPRQDAKYFVHVQYMPDTLHLFLMADTAYLPRPVVERLLRAMEALLVRSVHGEVGLREAAGPDRAPRPDGWVRADSCWFDLAETRRLVSAAAGGAEVRLSLAQDGPERLVADVTATAPGTAPEELHRAVVALVEHRTDAVAPHHYRVSTPSGELLAEGSGRP